MCPCPLPLARTGTAPGRAATEPTLGDRTSSLGHRPWSVVWARGPGCPALSDLLGEGQARRVGPDLRASCIEARADLLVAGRFTSFDLVPIAVPHAFDAGAVTEVVAAVAGGPHSLFAARVAERLAGALGVPAALLASSPDAGSDEAAEEALRRAADLARVPERRLVRAANPAATARGLSRGSLLVLGAPGGTWWRRQFFGPGHRLQAEAPAGAVVVRTAPLRCFHEMSEPAAMGRQMPVGEALRLTTDAVLPVADDGYLVGLVHRAALQAAPPTATIGSLMEAPLSVRLEDPLAAARALAGPLAGSPVPVVDAGGRLCGLLALSPPDPVR